MKTYYHIFSSFNASNKKYWWDHHLRMWTLVRIDTEGNQIGEAEYFGNRTQLLKNYPFLKFQTQKP